MELSACNQYVSARPVTLLHIHPISEVPQIITHIQVREFIDDMKLEPMLPILAQKHIIFNIRELIQVFTKRIGNNR